jgi:glutamate synthase (NADPH/NADH) small chain
VPGIRERQAEREGKRVVVIGGGDTAMDCVRTAIRQGAKSVKCLYRRDRANMPGSQREVQNAEEEGVEFVWLARRRAPRKGRRRVKAVRATACGSASPTRRAARRRREIRGLADYDVKADMVIKALGFDPGRPAQHCCFERAGVC